MSYVLDEYGQAIIGALENPKYDWRTIEGIAEETGIDRDQVSLILQRIWSLGNVVESSVPDKKGRPLFTTRKHYYERQTVINRVLSALSDRIR